MTAVQPAASANGSFCATWSSGKFHGVIIPTTPAGSRTTKSVQFWSSSVCASPCAVAANAAAYPNNSMLAATSPDASDNGLPVSCASMRERLSCSCRIRAAAVVSTRDRCIPVGVGQEPSSNAVRAAWMARSASSRVPGRWSGQWR